MKMCDSKTRRVTIPVLALAMIAAVIGFIANDEVSAAEYTTGLNHWDGNLNCNDWVSFRVPVGATNVSFRLTGGGGAAGDNYSRWVFGTHTGYGGLGGRGGVVTGRLNGVAGQYVRAKIGCGGTDQGGENGARGYAAGGYVSSTNGGGGGGASALCLGTASACNSNGILAIAGGGGGGGGATVNVGGATRNGGSGGNAVSSTIVNRNQGSSRSGTSGGQGGNSGGVGGGGSSINFPPNSTSAPMVTPSYGQGGNGQVGSDNMAGGGGGAGLIGGAGGAGGASSVGAGYMGAGGGGGGSSWVSTTGGTVSNPDFSTADNTGSDCSGRTSNVTGVNAGHGAGDGAAGCAGYIEITYTLVSTATRFATSGLDGVNGQPSPTAITGVPLDRQPVIRAVNPGSPTGGSGGESISLSGNGLVCASNTVTTNPSGYAYFSGCRFNSSGSLSITATNNSRGVSVISNTVEVSSNNDWGPYTPTFGGSSCGTNYAVHLPTTSRKADVQVSGGGGGSGARRGGQSGPGGAGASMGLSNFDVPLNSAGRPTYSHFNILIGCGGGGGYQGSNTWGSGSSSGGAGGNGWGNGASGGSASNPSQALTTYRASGGGGGGGSVACFRDDEGACSSGLPVVVAGGGGGGGGGVDGNSGGAGSNSGTVTTASHSWYGSSPGGNRTTGRSGANGHDGQGGGGGMSSGGSAGAGYQSSQNGTAGAGNSTSGGTGGSGGAASGSRRNASGGGGGGGYYGGGGGGGDAGSSNAAGGGGGGGSSWNNTSLNGTRSFSQTGGGSGGNAPGSSNSNGNPGAAGSRTFSISGTAIDMKSVDDQSHTVGTNGISLTVPYVWSDVFDHLHSPTFSVTGLPSTMGYSTTNSGNNQYVTISGNAPTTAGVYTISVTGETRVKRAIGDAQVNAPLSVTQTFEWRFVPDHPHHLTFGAQPANPSPAAQQFNVDLTIRDQYGNHVPDASNSVSVTLNPSPNIYGANLSGGAARVSTGGEVAFDLVVDRTGFGFTLTASSAGLSPAVSQPFDVVVFSETDVVLRHTPYDPDLQQQSTIPGAGVYAVTYIACPGFRSTTPCPNPLVLNTLPAVGESGNFQFTWIAAPGDYRILARFHDKVGNISTIDVSSSPSTPVRVHP